MNRRAGYVLVGAFLVLLGLFLPRGWYDALPRPQEQLASPPIKGVTLLQIAFVLQGLILLWLSTRQWRFVRLSPNERLPQTILPPDEHDIQSSTSLGLLATISAAALALRCLHLGSDLWLDEITPIILYREMSIFHIITSYISSNNHLLNTLLVKLAIVFFGEQEWAVRLPAMLFGVATIPAMYWVSRFALSRRGSLCVAALLAVSYHHIFFSQNARGYTAYLFFSVISSGLLVKGLQEDRARDWVLYVLATFFNFASHLNSVFVFVSHVLVAAIELLLLKQDRQSILPLARRLTAVFFVAGILIVNLYITIVPQVYVYSMSTYHDPAAGFSPFSAEFFREIWRGISAGFGASFLFALIPGLIVVATGFFVFLRRQWALTLALTLPGLLTILLLLAQGLDFSPRFFLLWLPLTMLVTVQGIHTVLALLSQKLGATAQLYAPRVAVMVVLLGVAISLFSLRRYYSIPKQSYRASLQYIENQRQPGDPIIASYLSEHGLRFYGKRFGLEEGKDWFPVRSVESLDSVLSSSRGHSGIVVTTFARALRITHPDLLQRILDGWTLDRTFPATIGDGEISIWRPRSR